MPSTESALREGGGGSASPFRRALNIGNMAIIRSAAGELPHVDVADAIAVASRSAAQSLIGSSALRCGGPRASASNGGK